MADAPEIKHIFSAEDEDCLSLEAMRAYQEGRLKAVERHRVERHLLNCELCSMAIEGIEGQSDAVIETGAAAIADAAWARVQVKEKRRSPYIWISAAASVMLLIGITWFIFRPPSDEKMQAVFSEMIQETQAADTNLDDGIAQARPEEARPVTEESPLPDVQRVLPLAKEPHDAAKPVMEQDAPASLKVAPAPTPTAGPTKGNLYFNNADGATTKDAIKATRIQQEEERSEAGKLDLDQNQLYSESDDYAGDVVTAEKMENTQRTVTNAGNQMMAKENVTVMDKRAVSLEKQKSKPLAKKDQQPRARSEAKSPVAAGKNGADFKEAKTAAPVRDELADGEDAPELESITLSTGVAAPVPPGNVASDSISVAGYLGSSFEQGMEAYRRKDYADAATNLRAAAAQTPSNLQAHLYAANSFLNIGQPEAALFHLDRILAQAPNSYTEDAEWYKALAYLKMNDASAAKRQLNKVQQSGSKHSAKAKKSLDQL